MYAFAPEKQLRLGGQNFCLAIVSYRVNFCKMIKLGDTKNE